MDHTQLHTPWMSDCLPNHYLGPAGHPLWILRGAPWPQSYEDFSALLTGPLEQQRKTFKTKFRDVETFRTHDQQDKAYGALALLGEFWRMHKALTDTGAERAVMQIRSVPLLPHDYVVTWKLEGGQIALPKRRWWQRRSQEDGITMPNAFPDDILAIGANLLLDRSSPLIRKSGDSYYLNLERDIPLEEQIEGWFGKDYCHDWKHRVSRPRKTHP